MKKVVVLFLCLIMVLNLAGCTAASGSDNPPAVDAVSQEGKIYQGLGISNLHRVGPGKDSEGNSVYSVNQVFANVLFDEEGKILSVYVDQLEVASPNYTGEGMPVFSGFPTTANEEETLLREVAGWKTKRERGDSYQLTSGTWAEQMDAYQEFFVGKTVNEIVKWFGKYASSINGRPLKEGMSEVDQSKFDSLSDDEKAVLGELTSSATMSLNDDHGNIILALRRAYDNKVLVEIDIK